MHALIQNDQIVQIGPIPTRWFDGDRWHDWRSDNPSTDPADYGWAPVVESPRPEDTDTETHDGSYEVIDGQPVRVWTPREWTADEIAERMAVRARLDSHDERLARIEAHLWPADPDPDPETPIDAPSWGDYNGVWPNGKLLSDGGAIWRNTSGVPLTVPPSGFPGTPDQWSHLFVEVTTEGPGTDPDPDPWPQWRGEWSADATYVPGDHVTRDGVVYRCLVAHGPEHQGAWGPPATGVWTTA